jgi:hypothetical protein
MSWNTGSRIMSDIISSLLDSVDVIDTDARDEMYKILIRVFEEYDCDTLDECVPDDPVFERAFYAIHPLEDDGWGEEDSTIDDEEQLEIY